LKFYRKNKIFGLDGDLLWSLIYNFLVSYKFSTSYLIGCSLFSLNFILSKNLNLFKFLIKILKNSSKFTTQFEINCKFYSFRSFRFIFQIFVCFTQKTITKERIYTICQNNLDLLGFGMENGLSIQCSGVQIPVWPKKFSECFSILRGF
jgi:hypothetical protein